MKSLVLILALAVAGCSTHAVRVEPQQSIVKAGESISIQVSGPHTRAVSRVTSMLKHQFEQKGVTTVPAGHGITSLTVELGELDLGSLAGRILVSFGAGHGALAYVATYQKDGVILAQLESTERYNQWRDSVHAENTLLDDAVERIMRYSEGRGK